MNVRAKRLPLRVKTFVLTVGAAALLQSCAQTNSQDWQPIEIDGSSTVYPITQAVAKQFQSENPNQVEVKVNFSGTGGGFKKFCAGQTNINNASRPILTEEMEACDEAKIRYIELPIAFDALTVVVNRQNNWVKSITIAELKKMWEPAAQNKITSWRQIRSSWLDRSLNLYGPGADSGTFDYFTEAIVGKAGASRKDYVYSEDDRVLVNGVSQNPNALGYFGYAYYEENQDKLKAVAIDSGSGPVLPSRANVAGAIYQPLSRPLFIYINYKAAQDNPALREFVEFYLEKAPEIVGTVGYVPLPNEGYYLSKIHFQRGKAGTVFEGKSKFNLTIGELLRKQATF
ncbi:MAG: PstS family phosphate ABC transporter substrate-binding protein [Xenococcaceae cyanobacterium]